ncbi:MAG: glucosaminidase domain-containing protein, partial [Synergistaceae bacterium]|nr:glucosaminidase domain-containing protein [Synergistaceae bacterium]
MSRFFRIMLLSLSAYFCLSCGASFAETAEEFYNSAKKIPGIHAFAATCHSAHETGDWTSALWKTANNGAGIKAD